VTVGLESIADGGPRTVIAQSRSFGQTRKLAETGRERPKHQIAAAIPLLDYLVRRSSSDWGIVKLIALAVLRVSTRSNLVGC